MNLNRVILSIFLILLHPASVVNADPDPAAVDLCRSATVLVELPGRREFATAFCIHSDGYFITSSHVATGKGAKQEIRLVSAPGTAREQRHTSSVVKAAQNTDLALLYCPEMANLPAVPLSRDVELRETAPVTIFGYPRGSLRNARDRKYPNISVRLARITTLHGNRRSPDSIEFDVKLGPGNSGGPVLADDGRVIGVIASGTKSSVGAMAIPERQVRAFLQTPVVSFRTPEIAWDNRYEPMTLKIAARTLLRDSVGIQSVSARITAADRTTSVFARPESEDQFVAKFVPIPTDAGPPKCRAEIEFQDGRLSGDVTDIPLQLGAQTVRLSELEVLSRHEDRVDVTKADGTKLVGRWPAQRLNMDVGGQILQIDIAKAVQIRFRRPTADPVSVELNVEAVTASGFKTTVNRTLTFAKTTTAMHSASTSDENDLPVFQPPNIASPDLQGIRKVIELPEAFTQVCSGGGGRYLLFYLPESSVVSVFDVSAADVVAELPITGSQPLIAADLEKLYVVLPGTHLIQRWDLSSLKREKVAPVPGTNVPRTVMTGSAARGLLWLWSGGSIQAIDPETLKPADIEGKVLGGDPKHGYRMLLSADGSTMTGWHNGLSSPPYDLLKIHGHRTSKSTSPFGEGYNGRWMWPNADGRLIFGHGSTVYDHHFRRIAADWLKGTNIIPSGDPRYFLLVRAAENDRSSVSVCTSCDRQIIYTLLRAENVTGDSPLNRGMFHFQPRVYFVPSARVLILLPAGEKQIVVRRLDVDEELRQIGVDYLYVDSFPPVSALRGRNFEYRIEPHTSHPGVSYSLESGPDGMTVSPTGVVEWSISERFAEDSARAVISIRDAAGAEVLHTIRLDILSE